MATVPSAAYVAYRVAMRKELMAAKGRRDVVRSSGRGIPIAITVYLCWWRGDVASALPGSRDKGKSNILSKLMTS